MRRIYASLIVCFVPFCAHAASANEVMFDFLSMILLAPLVSFNFFALFGLTGWKQQVSLLALFLPWALIWHIGQTAYEVTWGPFNYIEFYGSIFFCLVNMLTLFIRRMRFWYYLFPSVIVFGLYCKLAPLAQHTREVVEVRSVLGNCRVVDRKLCATFPADQCDTVRHFVETPLKSYEDAEATMSLNRKIVSIQFFPYATRPASAAPGPDRYLMLFVDAYSGQELLKSEGPDVVSLIHAKYEWCESQFFFSTGELNKKSFRRISFAANPPLEDRLVPEIDSDESTSLTCTTDNQILIELKTGDRQVVRYLRSKPGSNRLTLVPEK